MLLRRAGDQASPPPNPKLQAKLDQLEKELPSWLISPSRLELEQGPDGDLVLLGRGAYGRVYRGWLLPAQHQGSEAAIV